jgi:deazaflavin-dependent oxidoreductase (nitroreductase family)
MSVRLNPTWRRLFRVPVYLYRLRCGWVLGRRFMLLVHVGRRTGRRRETVLEVMEYRENGPEVVVMSGFGHGADWLRNIEASPQAEVVIGCDHFAASYCVLSAEEATRVVKAYEQRHRFLAPIVRLVLGRLLGRQYRGSDSDRRALVAQLPLVAFRPRP